LTLLFKGLIIKGETKITRKKESPLWEEHRKELRIDNRYNNILKGAFAKDIKKHKKKGLL
jgi:hypothetical protein